MAVKSSYLIKWWGIWCHQIYSSALKWLVTRAFLCCSLCISLPYCFLPDPLEASRGSVFILGECDWSPNQSSGEQLSKVFSSVKIAGVVSWHAVPVQPGQGHETKSSRQGRRALGYQTLGIPEGGETCYCSGLWLNAVVSLSPEWWPWVAEAGEAPPWILGLTVDFASSQFLCSIL